MAIPTFAVTPFQGVSGASKNLNAGAASANVEILPAMPPDANPKLRQVRICNLSLTDDAFIAFGDSSVAAVLATGMAVPHGDVEIFTIGSATHIAAITAGGAVVLNLTPGGGV